MKKLLIIIILFNSFIGKAQWTQLTNLNQPMGGLFTDLFTFNSDSVIAVGQFEVAFRTSDAGSSWTNLGPSSSNDWFESIDFVDSNNGFVCTLQGAVFKTSDCGLTWTKIFTGSTSNPLYSIAFLNDTIGFAVGASNLIKTTNGGTSWNYLSSFSSQSLTDINFINSSIGFVVGFGGIIFKTINGGINWTAQTSGTTNILWSSSFTNINYGWSVGNGGTILKTNNGGTSWSLQNSGTIQNLFDVFALDSNTAYAVGASGTILFTSNGGVNWTTQSSGTTRDLNEIKFTTYNIGYIVGDYGTILKTTIVPASLFEKNNKFSFTIYPNPFEFQATMQFNSMQNKTRISIVNVAGIEVKHINFSGTKLILNKGELSSGTYFIIITDNQNNISSLRINII